MLACAQKCYEQKKLAEWFRRMEDVVVYSLETENLEHVALLEVTTHFIEQLAKNG